MIYSINEDDHDKVPRIPKKSIDELIQLRNQTNYSAPPGFFHHASDLNQSDDES